MSPNPQSKFSQIDEANLKLIENQLSYESMMSKKFNQYAEYLWDNQLKNICQESSEKHRNNYISLLNYLNSYK